MPGPQAVVIECAEDNCHESVVDGMYSACFGCALLFCDEHLIYCVDHENQHCEVCCENGTAPPKDAA